MQLTGETPATGGHKVFISYARYDRERVQPLADALEAQGCSVWIDSNLVAGEVFAAEIEAALRSSTAVIVVWSETSVHSSWVRDEAGLARDLGRLVPVRIDDVAAPLGFGQFHMVNLTKWHGEPDARVIGEIMHAVTAVAHGTPLPMDPNGVAPVRRASPPRRLVLLGAGAALVPLAAGGAWWLNSRRAAPPAAVPAPAHSVAVLPFDNLSGDPGQDYFADGLSEEVRSALARIDSLQIAAPTSSNQFRGTKQDVAAIGRRLGVAFVLNGSVRRGGKMVRVTAQLSEAATGFERWSQTYDRPTADILKIQTDIAELVAGALKVKVMGVAPAVAIGQTTNPTAYDRYLLGRRALFGLSGDEATYREALQDFDVAVAADPSFAAAHALRARALIAIAGQFAKAAEIPALTRTALEAAQRAVTLAPDLDMASRSWPSHASTGRWT